MNAEPDGFAQFVEARERALQRTAWLLTGDWALAEDLVQTSLARSWPRWERIRRRDNPEIYVRRVMVNTWVSWSRRRWWGEQASAAVPDTAAPGDLATEVAVRTAVQGALKALTARQRAVVVLRIFDDLTEPQVAQVLNCATGTVKSTMARALTILQASAATGKVVRVLYRINTGDGFSFRYFNVDPSGRYLILNTGTSSRSANGWVYHGRLIPLKPKGGDAWYAAW